MTTKALLALVGEWREKAHKLLNSPVIWADDTAAATAYDYCADALSAIISELRDEYPPMPPLPEQAPLRTVGTASPTFTTPPPAAQGLTEALCLLAHIADNLNDMPISASWAAKTTPRIEAMLNQSALRRLAPAEGAAQGLTEGEHFCDGHCVWTDHHPDCPIGRRLAPAEGMVSVPREAEFEGWQDDMLVFGCSGPREEAEGEVLHYLQQYTQDGPVTVYEVTRKEWKP